MSGLPKPIPVVSISSIRSPDGITGKSGGVAFAEVSKKTLYVPGSEDVNVNEAELDETATGFAGAGDSTVAAPGEKKRYAGAPSLVEKVIVSPLVTGTLGWLGTSTPWLFVREIAVLAMFFSI